MARRKLSLYGDPVLRRRAAPVTELGTDELRALIADMFETCACEEGIGLAAPQIGVSLRVFVLDCPEVPDEAESRREHRAVVNPEIVARHGTVDSEEGCLSVPGVRGVVKRAQRVRVRGLDADGHPVEFEASGLLAFCVQHEVDHLDGVLFVDRLSSLKRSLLARRLEEIAPG